MNRFVRRLYVLASLLLFSLAGAQASTSSAPLADYCGDQGRCFYLDIENNTGNDLTISVAPFYILNNCYDGYTGTQAIKAGMMTSISISRVQGHGCDGEGGEFQIGINIDKNEKNAQFFEFSNRKELYVSIPNNQYDVLLGSPITGPDGWTHYRNTINGKWDNPQTCDPWQRCPLLYINNNTDTDAVWKLTPVSCYEGTQGDLPIPAGSRAQVWLARVQGHGCDGKGGYFSLTATSGLKGTETLQFSNRGELGFATRTGSYISTLSGRQNNNAYEYSVDENIVPTSPNPPSIPYDPAWKTDNITNLQFTTTGFWPNYYEPCVGVEFYHPQHVIRMPNDKDGNAYLMVSQSREHNGYISLLKVDKSNVDPATDAITNLNAGSVVWQDVFTGSFNGKINPIGNWNHPGKMSVLDGVLVVAAQNWAPEGWKNFLCGKWFEIKGDSEDAVLFYDVRNPTQPKYMGKITAGQLGVPNSELAEAELAYNPAAKTYLLSTGGDGVYPVLSAPSLNAEFGHWTRVPNAASFSGQHGSVYNRGADPMQLVFFDASRSASTYTMMAYSYLPTAPFLHYERVDRQEQNLPGANRDWDSSSLYVSAQGKPIIYTVKSLPGDNYQIYQVLPPAK